MSCLNFVRSVEAAQAAPTPGPPQHRRQSPPPATPPPLTRRELLATTSAAVLATSFYTAAPAAALPLAPLGGVERVGGAKRTGLSAQQVADILAQNLAEGQYFITGDLTPEVFADDCRFRDPTNDIRGLSRYVKALGLLFDASHSAVRLRSIRVTAPDTIEAEWHLGGYLKFPWHPRVEPFTGRTTYTLNDEGLVAFQDQTWDVSAFEALRESFTPTGGVRDDIVSMP